MAITEFKISGVKGTVSLFDGTNSAITGLDVKGDRVVDLDPSTSVGLVIFSLYIYIACFSLLFQRCELNSSSAHTHTTLQQIHCFLTNITLDYYNLDIRRMILYSLIFDDL